MVHYVIGDAETGVSPLCGSWGKSFHWTRVREAVSCPGCLRRLVSRSASRRLAVVGRATATR